MENSKQAITFISFACTGAVTENIINKSKKAAEHLKKIDKPDLDKRRHSFVRIDRKVRVFPQMMLLKQTLKDSTRKIDLILLSTGGNDIEFTKYVGNVVLQNKNARTPWSVKVPTIKTRKDINKTLKTNYKKFDKSIKTYFEFNRSDRIILTAYPNILHDENNVLCNGERKAFDIPFGFSSERKRRIKNTEDYLINHLLNIQKDLSKNLKWNLVTSHIEQYKKHGFCAKKDKENFIIPHKKNENDPWRPSSPTDYIPYADVQRWIRLPLDSILTINRTRGTKKTFYDDLMFSDETSGMMHPNANGLATTADANVKLINEKGLLK